MDILELIKSRRSVRLWTKQEVSNEVINKLVDGARWAPSSSNKQAYKLLVIRDKENIKFLGERLGGGVGFAYAAPVFILVLIDMRRYRLPHERHLAYLDGAAVIQNMLLVVHSLGLGACWLSWSVSDSTEAKVYELFNIPNYMLPVSVIALGYPLVIPEPPSRKKIEKFLLYERFGKAENITKKPLILC